MGGTWIYHTQVYTYRELMQYKLDRTLQYSRDSSHKNNYFSIRVPGKIKYYGIFFNLLTVFNRI